MVSLSILRKPSGIIRQLRHFSSQNVEYFGGSDLILRRAANIISNVTDRQPTRMLEIYPTGKLYSIFPSTPQYLAVTACTDDSDSIEVLKGMGYYSEIETVSEAAMALPFAPRSFQLVSMLRPTSFVPDSGDSEAWMPNFTANVPLTEAVRVLGHAGFALVGGDESQWNDADIMTQLLDLEEHGVDIMSVQKLDLAAPPVSDELASSADLPDGHIPHNYLLALLRQQ